MFFFFFLSPSLARVIGLSFAFPSHLKVSNRRKSVRECLEFVLGPFFAFLIEKDWNEIEKEMNEIKKREMNEKRRSASPFFIFTFQSLPRSFLFQQDMHTHTDLGIPPRERNGWP
jgi:hypothetical protein